MSKRIGLVVLAVLAALALLALPSVARRLAFYEGRSEPREIPRPDLSAVLVPTPAMPTFIDAAEVAAPGTILVDAAHSNNFQRSELNVLKSRLSARGQRLEWVESADDLPAQLRYARALVVISPQSAWTPVEVLAVRQFVAKGGRLLLVTDATRYQFLYDDVGNFLGLDHDAFYMNDLSGAFGLVFQPDYLYNTADNAGNFRNIKLTKTAPDALTQGVETLVFFASRSILSQEPALIQTSGGTRSSASERPDDVAVAVLAAGGNVLALGDLTFMTEPYNAVDDNDRFIANVAGFLSGAPRRYDLAEFPFFFGDEVDLVYTGDPLLDSDLLAGGGTLQVVLEDGGRRLTVKNGEDVARDTVFVGLYDQAAEAQTYLEAAQVTLWVTPTDDAVDGTADSSTETPKEITATQETEPEARNRVEIGGLGELASEGTSLLVLQGQGNRQVLVVLSDTAPGVDDALRRLAEGDLADCVLSAGEPVSLTLLALCPTGEVKPGDGAGGWKEPEKPTPAPEIKPVEEPKPEGVLGSILIFSLDDGEARYDGLTGADELEAILGSDYDVTVWSQKDKGTPPIDDWLTFDLVLLASGDVEGSFGIVEQVLLEELLGQEVPVLVIGGYVADMGTESVQRDVQVRDAENPIAAGFGADEVIAFVAPPSGKEYSLPVLEDSEEEGTAIPFQRGPKSEDAGAPAVRALEAGAGGTRLVFVGFPIYLLPGDAQTRLVLNAVEWLLGAPAG